MGMALIEIHVCRLFCDAYQVLSCMKMLNTMEVRSNNETGA